MSLYSDTAHQDETGLKLTDIEDAKNELTNRIKRIQKTLSQRRIRTINQIIIIKELGGSCARCGLTYPPPVYDFHHVNPSKKSFRLDKSMFSLKLERLRAEAAKCVLLCSNCHRMVHAFNEARFLVIDGVNNESVTNIMNTNV